MGSFPFGSFPTTFRLSVRTREADAAGVLEVAGCANAFSTKVGLSNYGGGYPVRGYVSAGCKDIDLH